MSNHIAAPLIIDLLAEKHAKDVFVAQCNTGSSWGGCQRLDAWVLKRTWSPVTTIGYEVKVSRSDFLNDGKWKKYLNYCHQLYFVCPPNLIEKEELPQDVGLLWTSKTGSRLYTKRKAIHREPELCPELMYYVLMSRTQIVSDMYHANRAELKGAEYWRWWLGQKAENRELGHQVSKAVNQRVAEAKSRTYLAEAKVESYTGIRARLVELGLDPDEPIGRWSINDRLNEAYQAIPRDLLWDLKRVAKQTAEAHDELEKLVKRHEALDAKEGT